jgi:hypothetical protein
MNRGGIAMNQALYGAMDTGINFLPDDIAGLNFLYGNSGGTDMGLTWVSRTPKPSGISCGGTSRCISWNSFTVGSEEILRHPDQTIMNQIPIPALVLGGSQANWSGRLRGYLANSNETIKRLVYMGLPMSVNGNFYAHEGGAIGNVKISITIPADMTLGLYSMVYELTPTGSDRWSGNNKIKSLAKVRVYE